MIRKLLLLFIVATLHIGCSPVTPVIPASTVTPVIPTATATPTPEPVINFLFPNLLFPPNENGLVLDTQIYALNKDIIFLFGGMYNAQGTQQSTLLRSTDGGKHWAEVSNPVKASDVIDFQMLDNGEGWALIMWVVEGPGDILLFHTTDFGRTWSQTSKVIKPDLFSVPANMKFFDSKNGQMIMSVVDGLHDRLVYMTTEDGGLTWQESGSFFPPFENRMKGIAVETLLYESRKDFSQSTSLDYFSKWKLEDTDKSIIIYRQLYENYSWSNWDIANILPKQFNYKDGQIIIP